jgi:hypothetical protein
MNQSYVFANYGKDFKKLNISQVKEVRTPLVLLMFTWSNICLDVVSLKIFVLSSIIIL